MKFFSTQGNISDINGNLLFSSNGCWIANTTGDTMMNGTGLNPSLFTSSYCPDGLPLPHGNVIIPYPGDSTKYVLFHQTGGSTGGLASHELFFSVIDMTLDSGLGGVTLKNQIAFQDTLSWGIAACKHANGRDWWIIAFKDSTDIVYEVLLTPTGLATVNQLSLGVPIHFYNMGQAQFSPDGKKFAYHYRDFFNGSLPVTHQIRLFDFDRCSGMFTNPNIISHTDSVSGNGLAFSSNSKYLYFTLFDKVMQVNTDTNNIQASLDTVAIYDGYAFPYWYLKTDFWLMYLAANGKIYISSGNSVVDLHYINYPDSSGIDCDVQQHALHIPTYTGRGNVYHPNYYLGCDTTSGCPCFITGINEYFSFDFNFRIYPNPISNNSLNIGYILPQNKAGVFLIYDMTGKVIFKYNLPQWSNEQAFSLPDLSNGVYNCILASNGYRMSKKLVVIK